VFGLFGVSGPTADSNRARKIGKQQCGSDAQSRPHKTAPR
jgi:hypothetical protein